MKMVTKRLKFIAWLVVLVFIGILGCSRVVSLRAAWLRNQAGGIFLASLQSTDNDCTALPLQSIAEPLVRAMTLQPNSLATWKALVRLSGLNNRQWITQNADRLSSLMVTAAGTFRDPLALVRSRRMSTTSPWGLRRCLATWGAWTAGLAEAAAGRWEEAVAQYQAGLGLAPGRVPPGIIREYYEASARQILSSDGASAAERLAAAKYLALAGRTTEAAGLFSAVSDDQRLDAQGRSQALDGLAWTQAGGDTSGRLPLWLGEISEGTPQWTLAQGSAVLDVASGRRLIGFDVDSDVMDAGVEVMGVLYWQLSGGDIERQAFRQPDLWPNSGSSWRGVEGFNQCIPGYTEPGWVKPCAGHVVPSTDVDSRAGMLGTLYNAPGGGPDSYLSTASVPLHMGSQLIVAGRWRSEGEFPRGHIARIATNREYESILELSRLPAGAWRLLASATKPSIEDSEFFFWIRPRAGVGQGELLFDDVFSFEIPEQ